MTDRRYLRAREVAELTGLSVRTVRRRIADETIRSVKWGGTRLVPATEFNHSPRPAPGHDELEICMTVWKPLSK